MTNSTAASGQCADRTPPGLLITAQIEAIEAQLAASGPAVIDLSNAASARTATSPPFRAGDHRREAEAALSMFEDACDEPGGELHSWPLALAAVVHTLLAIEERLGS